MDVTSKLNEAYNLYVSEKYSEAFTLIEEILKEDPQNSYALKYKEIILPKLNKVSEVGKVATVKAKTLRCSHCQAAIAMSALNEVQKTRLSKNDYNNLEIKCPYCHTTFTLQKKSSESIIGVKVGDKITYNGKNYTTVGSVLYEGRWLEGGYSGRLQYLEWILLGQDNSYLYFSEGYFIDDGVKNYEFEFSEKCIPNFEISHRDDYLYINGNNHKIKEKNIVTAKMVYGENSKVFKVGERVDLYNFSYGGKNYILEKETAGSQKEAGIYLAKDVSKKEACNIFGKEYKPDFAGGASNVGNKLLNGFDLEDNGTLRTIIILLCIGFLPIIILGYLIYHFEWYKSKYFYIFFVGPIFGFLIVPAIISVFMETKTEIALADIGESNKYKIEFDENSTTLRDKHTTSTTSYDYGGTRYYYKETTGLEFSVVTEEDLEIIENLKNNSGSVDATVKAVFSEKIYKLR